MDHEIKKSAPLSFMKRAVPALILLLTLTACAGPFEQVSYDARESYRSVGFPDHFETEGMAFLTATGGALGVEYRKLLGDIVEEVIKKEHPEIRVIPYWRCLSIINMDGLTGDYAEMLKEYETTGILNKDALRKLSKAIGVKYFMQPRLVTFNQSQTTRFSFLGFTMLKTHETMVKLYLEIWNAQTGEIIWIGVGDTTMAMENYRAKPIAFEDVATYAVRKIVVKMP